MKKISELFDELGFQKEGSSAVKEAFVKHLIRASTGHIVKTPTEASEKTIECIQNRFEKAPQKPSFHQLSFDFEQLEKPDSRPGSKVS